jgi:ferric-dicitrate binding protein FerR (iron transport regulator)
MLTPSQVLRYAAVFFILLIPAILFFHHYTKSPTRQLEAGLTVVEGTLPDGSLVTLNTGSHLEYPARFDRFKRGVQLRGAAYFEVIHNTGTPFVIYYKNARVEVLGTKFYVNTNAENGKMEVVLQEGSVSVYFKNRPNESVTLDPREKAEITPDQTAIRKRMNDDDNYLAWKSHHLVFNNEELSRIVTTLTAIYNTKILITTPQLRKCRVTATFDNQSLDSVLNVLKATLGLDIALKGGIYEISGKTCE